VAIRKDLLRLFQGHADSLRIVSAIDARAFDNGDVVFQFDRLFVHMERERGLIDAQVSLTAGFADPVELVDVRTALEPPASQRWQGWGLDEACSWLVGHYAAILALVDSKEGRSRLASIADAREQAAADWIEGVRAPESRASGPMAKTPRRSPLDVSKAYASFEGGHGPRRLILIVGLFLLLLVAGICGFRYLENVGFYFG